MKQLLISRAPIWFARFFIFASLGVPPIFGAHAQTLPRAPVGSSFSERNQSFSQVPGGLGRSTGSVGITNNGDQTIFITYWNGAGGWQNLALPAGQLTLVSCPACGPTISIAFNDGHTTRTVTASEGSNYVMYWSEQASAWDLAPAQ